MADAAKDAWVERVLGVTRPGAGAAWDPAVLARAAEGWQRAIEAVDRQIEALRRQLSGSDDEELNEIAEFGLGALTGGHKVAVTAALLDAQAGNPRGRQALRAAVAGFREHLTRDPRIAACDDNPFELPMTISATLLPALDGIAACLPGR
jgi:hypothetical protein